MNLNFFPRIRLFAQTHQSILIPLATILLMGLFFFPVAFPFGFFTIGQGLISQYVFIFSMVGLGLGFLSWLSPIQATDYRLYPIYVLGLTFFSLLVVAKACMEPFFYFRVADAWLLVGVAGLSIYGWLKIAFTCLRGTLQKHLGLVWLAVSGWSLFVAYTMYECANAYIADLVRFAN